MKNPIYLPINQSIIDIKKNIDSIEEYRLTTENSNHFRKQNLKPKQKAIMQIKKKS